MADFDNGLPPKGTDPSEGAITSFSYVNAELDPNTQEEQEIFSMGFSNEEYVKEDIQEQEILSFSYSVQEPDRINYMSMT